MKMETSRETQGQMVQYAYGWHDGMLYRRISDRSDRTERWYICEEPECAPELVPEAEWVDCLPPVDE